jgi:integrase
MSTAGKRRRQYGTGTVFQRADGLWIGRFEAGWDETGARRQKQVSARTEALCKQRLKDKQLEVATQGLSSVTTSRTTVKSWSEEWLPQHARSVRPNTYTTDAGAIRKWIIPTVGHRRLAELTPADLRKLRDAVTGAGRSTTTALHAHKTLTTMLKAAIVEGHQVPQRVLLAPKPKKGTSDRTRLSLADTLSVLAVARERPDAARWVAAFLQGMRQGECLGLTWDHVDLKTGRVDVVWQLDRLSYRVARDPSSGFRVPDGFDARQLDGQIHLTRPKTRAGRRGIPLMPWMVQALTVERERWEPNPWGLVWTEDGHPIDDGADRARWHGIQREAGVAHPSGRPYHLHEARHTTATILRELGVDTSTIETIIGQAVLVEDYIHIGDERQRSALEGVARMLQLGD